MGRIFGIAAIALALWVSAELYQKGVDGAFGGVLASMVDIAMLVAVFAELRPGEQPAGTAELGITYLRQAQGDEIFAEARVIKRGRQLAVIEVDIQDAEGRLCAKGRTLYAFRAPVADP